MKIESLKLVNLILTLIHFDWIEKGSGLSQSDLIFFLIVSGTVVRAGNPREIDGTKSSLGQRFDRQLYPASGEIDNPSLTLMTHFLTAQYCGYCCPLLCLSIFYFLLFTKCHIDNSVLIHAK